MHMIKKELKWPVHPQWKRCSCFFNVLMSVLTSTQCSEPCSADLKQFPKVFALSGTYENLSHYLPSELYPHCVTPPPSGSGSSPELAPKNGPEREERQISSHHITDWNDDIKVRKYWATTGREGRAD